MENEVNYSDYLQLDKILNAQFPESEKVNAPAHDEMLFIIIHQAYELWFREILHEVNSCIAIMNKSSLNDNSPELQTVVHRLARVSSILEVLVKQIDIMETMNPMDFLDFRDLLRPASGFQSWQFKMIEARLGLKYAQRHGQDLYAARLRPDHIEDIKQAEEKSSLLELVNAWLERMPFFNEPENWLHYSSRNITDSYSNSEQVHIFWLDYRCTYQKGLAKGEEENLRLFDELFFHAVNKGSLSAAARRAALFIMLYKGYPVLQLPFHLLNNLLEIDEQLSTWRYRHMSMVHRMIGTRIGTGGSTGRDYLQSALDKHYIFKEIAQLTSFLIERRRLPQLPPEIEKRLGFSVS